MQAVQLHLGSLNGYDENWGGGGRIRHDVPPSPHITFLTKGGHTNANPCLNPLGFTHPAQCNQIVGGLNRGVPIDRGRLEEFCALRVSRYRRQPTHTHRESERIVGHDADSLGSTTPLHVVGSKRGEHGRLERRGTCRRASHVMRSRGLVCFVYHTDAYFIFSLFFIRRQTSTR